MKIPVTKVILVASSLAIAGLFAVPALNTADAATNNPAERTVAKKAVKKKGGGKKKTTDTTTTDTTTSSDTKKGTGKKVGPKKK